MLRQHLGELGLEPSGLAVTPCDTGHAHGIPAASQADSSGQGPRAPRGGERERERERECVSQGGVEREGDTEAEAGSRL